MPSEIICHEPYPVVFFPCRMLALNNHQSSVLLLLWLMLISACGVDHVQSNHHGEQSFRTRRQEQPNYLLKLFKRHLKMYCGSSFLPRRQVDATHTTICIRLATFTTSRPFRSSVVDCSVSTSRPCRPCRSKFVILGIRADHESLGTNQYKCYFNQGPVGPPFTNDPNCSGPKADVQGGITAAMPGGSFVGALISGFLTDWLGRKRAVQVGAVIW